MKANELRVGNYISTAYMQSGVFEVISICDSSCEFIDANGEDFLSSTIWPYVKFIPLTEEWLTKLGFERGGYDLIEVRHPDNTRLLLVGYLGESENESSLGWNYNLNGEVEGTTYEDSIITIKYVHQLQNLYFALTGSELELVNKL